jgi:hypothetical protein
VRTARKKNRDNHYTLQNIQQEPINLLLSLLHVNASMLQNANVKKRMVEGVISKEIKQTEFWNYIDIERT